MPGYPYLQNENADSLSITFHLRALQRLGVPYSEDEIISSPKELEGKTAEDALVAYLQGLGTNRKAIKLEERINTSNLTINEGK